MNYSARKQRLNAESSKIDFVDAPNVILLLRRMGVVLTWFAHPVAQIFAGSALKCGVPPLVAMEVAQTHWRWLTITHKSYGVKHLPLHIFFSKCI
mmetsp:Transcript_391/g.453  ORF Transcript_391/g.453 Transcript_391/m.453 type:complete len:95 (+) Transcript_391:1030-1314(+)